MILTTARPTGTRVSVTRDLARGGIITDETAVTIASWYASPGPVGRHLAALATTGTVAADDLLDDIDRTLIDYGDDTDEHDELTALAAWVSKEDPMSTTPDPIARAIAARDQIQACREAMSRSRQERQAALIEARESMTVAEIAEALDLTTAQVYAIMAGRR